jgi:hypothetical protein
VSETHGKGADSGSAFTISVLTDLLVRILPPIEVLNEIKLVSHNHSYTFSTYVISQLRYIIVAFISFLFLPPNTLILPHSIFSVGVLPLPKVLKNVSNHMFSA